MLPLTIIPRFPLRGLNIHLLGLDMDLLLLTSGAVLAAFRAVDEIGFRLRCNKDNSILGVVAMALWSRIVNKLALCIATDVAAR